ncbi:hypothetical protein [Mesorhizobium sp.]|uniref:hypothetical protein n=1 Tax=Mesorhizobium sp. TaxID=1871066 RepID=UPI0025D74616|nr:hypothetical protein [Mesorhizobium sp.]
MLPLPPKQFSAQFLFERLDCARKRRLSDVAFLCRSGEIQRVGQGQKIADLLHLHRISAPQRNSIFQAQLICGYATATENSGKVEDRQSLASGNCGADHSDRFAGRRHVTKNTNQTTDFIYMT